LIEKDNGPMRYYNLSVEEVLYKLNSSEQGLTGSEVNTRLSKFGLNELEEKKQIPAWVIFLRQFKDFMILILVAAAILSGVMGDLTDTVIILIIVLLNAIIGFVQELA
jgi:Ca2+-transporting ATPase